MLHQTLENNAFSTSMRNNSLQQDVKEELWPTKRKTLSKIGSNIGPQIPPSLIKAIRDDGITHLNLHANSIQSLKLEYHDGRKSTTRAQRIGNIECLDQLVDINLSSNQLGMIETLSKATKISMSSPLTIIYLAPHLCALNLSANNLTNEALQMHLFAREHSPMTNLTTLNLSNNNLTIIPSEITAFCPNIKQLNLYNNSIKDLTNIEQLSNSNSLRQIMVDSNPLCSCDMLYREKIICSFGGNLVRCDDIVVDEEMRNQARAKLLIEYETKGKDAINTAVTKFSLIDDIHTRSSLVKRRDKMKAHVESQKMNTAFPNQRINENTDKISKKDREKEALGNMALFKLNSLETQVKKLSNLTEELLQTHNDQDVGKQTSSETDVIVTQRLVPLVCEAEVQTTFDSEHDASRSHRLVDPSTNQGDSNKKDEKFSSLAFALLKWNIYSLKMKISENRCKFKDLDVKDLVKEVIKTKDSSEIENQHTLIKNEMQKKDDLISQMKLEINILQDQMKEKEKDLLIKEKDYKMKIQRIRNEVEKNKAENMNILEKDREKYYNEKLREVQDCHERKVRELESSVMEYKRKVFEIEKLLEVKNIDLRRNEIEKLEVNYNGYAFLFGFNNNVNSAHYLC